MRLLPALAVAAVAFAVASAAGTTSRVDLSKRDHTPAAPNTVDVSCVDNGETPTLYQYWIGESWANGNGCNDVETAVTTALTAIDSGLDHWKCTTGDRDGDTTYIEFTAPWEFNQTVMSAMASEYKAVTSGFTLPSLQECQGNQRRDTASQTKRVRRQQSTQPVFNRHVTSDATMTDNAELVERDNNPLLAAPNTVNISCYDHGETNMEYLFEIGESFANGAGCNDVEGAVKDALKAVNSGINSFACYRPDKDGDTTVIRFNAPYNVNEAVSKAMESKYGGISGCFPLPSQDQCRAEGQVLQAAGGWRRDTTQAKRQQSVPPVDHSATCTASAYTDPYGEHYVSYEMHIGEEYQNGTGCDNVKGQLLNELGKNIPAPSTSFTSWMCVQGAGDTTSITFATISGFSDNVNSAFGAEYPNVATKNPCPSTPQYKYNTQSKRDYAANTTVTANPQPERFAAYCDYNASGFDVTYKLSIGEPFQNGSGCGNDDTQFDTELRKNTVHVFDWECVQGSGDTTDITFSTSSGFSDNVNSAFAVVYPNVNSKNPCPATKQYQEVPPRVRERNDNPRDKARSFLHEGHAIARSFGGIARRTTPDVICDTTPDQRAPGLTNVTVNVNAHANSGKTCSQWTQALSQGIEDVIGIICAGGGPGVGADLTFALESGALSAGTFNQVISGQLGGDGVQYEACATTSPSESSNALAKGQTLSSFPIATDHTSECWAWNDKQFSLFYAVDVGAPFANGDGCNNTKNALYTRLGSNEKIGGFVCHQDLGYGTLLTFTCEAGWAADINNVLTAMYGEGIAFNCPNQGSGNIRRSIEQTSVHALLNEQSFVKPQTIEKRRYTPSGPYQEQCWAQFQSRGSATSYEVDIGAPFDDGNGCDNIKNAFEAHASLRNWFDSFSCHQDDGYGTMLTFQCSEGFAPVINSVLLSMYPWVGKFTCSGGGTSRRDIVEYEIVDKLLVALLDRPSYATPAFLDDVLSDAYGDRSFDGSFQHEHFVRKRYTPVGPDTQSCHAKDKSSSSANYVVDIGETWADGRGCDDVDAALKAKLGTINYGGFDCMEDAGYGTMIKFTEETGHGTEINEALQSVYPAVNEFNCPDY